MIFVGQIWVTKPRRREHAHHEMRYLKIQHVGKTHVEALSAYVELRSDTAPSWEKGRVVHIAIRRLKDPAYVLEPVSAMFVRGYEDARVGRNDPPMLHVKQYRRFFHAYAAGQAFYHKKKGAVA